MDRHTKEQRSRNMAAIRSRGNLTTEQKFLALLREHKLSGWRRHKKGAVGSPDFLFPKARVVVFVDGCFWHGCSKHCIMPKSRLEYWESKIARNKSRDRVVTKHYKAKGWRVLRVWEHQLKLNSNTVVKRLRVLLEAE
jgi:DNA mismatch endonuclease (patch repair protein)